MLFRSLPSYFYNILPYQIHYQPYDFSHIVGQIQLLGFSALAFICLWHFKIYPPELNSTVLNSDWIYRKMLPGVIVPLIDLVSKLNVILGKNITNFSIKTKSYLATLMTTDRVSDREVGKDGFIIIQIFTIFLIFILISQIFKFF